MSKTTPNWKRLDLDRQCGTCEYFLYKIIDGTLTARGKCELTNTYKQRTETCKKYTKGD